MVSVERTKIDYVDAEHAPKERLVSPSLWPSLSVHVVASPASRAALEVGALTVHSFAVSNAGACPSARGVQGRRDRLHESGVARCGLLGSVGGG